MRLCYVAYSPLDLQSANSIQTFNTCRALAEQLGAGFTAVVPSFGHEDAPPFPVIRLRRIPLNKLSRVWASGWWAYAERLVYAWRAVETCRRHVFTRRVQPHPSLIYVRDAICAYRFIQSGWPVLYEVHDLEARHPGQNKSARLRRWLEQVDERTLRGAQGLVSLTTTFRDQVVAHGWQPASRVFVVPDAYDERIFFPRDRLEARRALGLSPQARIVCYAGLTFKYRGLEVLLCAFREWDEPCKQLVLVGGRPFEIQELQQAAQGLENEVLFVGRRDAATTAQYLAAADVLVIPDTVTESTASPLKMFEYMAMARPIVCVDRPALREILDDTAFYFARGDVAGLCAALNRAVRAEGAPQIERARARAAEFTYARRAARILAAVASLLQNSSA